MKRRDQLAVAGLALALAIVGVAMFTTDPAQSPQPTPIFITPPPGLTYREGVIGRPSSINPLTARTQVDRDLVALLFRGLLQAGPNGTLLPDLAKSWTVSADALTYTFTIRTDASWEDGQPVTAADVVFTVGLAQDPNYSGPLGATWQGITATAVSASVVRFTLSAPLGGFMRQALLPILPEHLLSDTAVTDLADSDFSSQPVGDGPYRIDTIDNSQALLARVTDVPAAGDSAAPTVSGSPGVPAGATASVAASASAPATTTIAASAAPHGNVDNIDLVFFNDQASAVASYNAGKLDAVSGLTPASVQAADRSGTRVASYPLTSLYSVVLNQRSTHPEFGTLGVRQALLAGIDRTAILNTVLLGRGTVAEAPLPSWSSAYDPTAVTVTPYSQTSAKAELTAAGWVHDQSGWTLPKATSHYAIRLLSPTEAANPVAFQVAGRVAAGWRGLGLEVNLQAFGAADYATHLSSGDFDAAVVDYQVGLDPDISPLLLSTQVAPNGSNLSGVADTTLDQLLTTVRTTTDPTARETAISALEKYVSTNVLMLPICFADYEFVVSNRVQNVSTNQIADPSGRFWDVLDWRLASDG
jgi:peptide/nickel transport system substrate-binding protein